MSLLGLDNYQITHTCIFRNFRIKKNYLRKAGRLNVHKAYKSQKLSRSACTSRNPTRLRPSVGAFSSICVLYTIEYRGRNCYLAARLLLPHLLPPTASGNLKVKGLFKKASNLHKSEFRPGPVSCLQKQVGWRKANHSLRPLAKGRKGKEED